MNVYTMYMYMCACVCQHNLNALQSGEKPVSEDRQKQSDLEANYDHVWGKERNDRRRTGR